MWSWSPSLSARSPPRPTDYPPGTPRARGTAKRSDLGVADEI